MVIDGDDDVMEEEEEEEEEEENWTKLNFELTDWTRKRKECKDTKEDLDKFIIFNSMYIHLVLPSYQPPQKSTLVQPPTHSLSQDVGF